VDLLAEHTRLAVMQAADGMPVEPEHLYVIPPGAYLSVSGGALRLSPPEMRRGAPRGARLPFDVLLHSLAQEYGARAACVVLSGSGTDGSAGLRAVKAAGGLVVVQDPAEADYDGMPRSAIATGDVDAVVPAAGILAVLAGAAEVGSADASASSTQPVSPRHGKDATALPSGAQESAPRAPSGGALSGAAPPRPAPSGPAPSRPAPSGPVVAPAARSGAAPQEDAPHGEAPGAAGSDPLSQVIALLRARTRHDFAPYKPGTLERRIGRRMALASLGRNDMGGYLELLRRDAGELDLLSKDLLIHVTSFFRDPAAYACLAEAVIPALLHGRAPDQPVRVWVAGCSTGEEAYSIVMLFREAMAAQRGGVGDAAGAEIRAAIKLQVFASDLDADAVAVAREGLYPASGAAEVSPERLARFFAKEDGHGYRVLPELRGAVVFTVQDLLSDAPFSRLDLVSCRNLMIYLGPEAQAKAAALFHFALREGGFLLLGSAETVGEGDGRFRMVQKAARLYRHVGPKRPGDLSFAGSLHGANGLRPARPDQAPAPSRTAALAELCRQTVLDLHAPAAVLCDARHECLYLLGPTDRYLHVPPGQATAGLVAMARGAVRTRLRAALGQAAQAGTRVTVSGGRVVRDGHQVPFSIDVQPLQHDNEALLLVCFVDAPVHASERRTRRAHDGQAGASPQDAPRIAELERELEALRAELEASNRALEASAEDQRAVTEEALSVNEEYQSTNEELLTSKEELQSLNEELTALNSQLQETLDRQRTTSDDLQNILYSTDVATLFLDRNLGIRFFTPATRALFNVIPGDIGRPLADLHSLATDTLLPADAQAVLHDLQPVEREVETPGGAWFRRRILPYRTEGGRGGAAGGGVEGVVITFNDITRRKQEAAALDEAKQAAEAANLAKSRFLAAASHDLRQPLQTLALLQGLLARAVTGTAGGAAGAGRAPGLVQRMDETLGAMSGMLDALLDINQIEAGVVRAELADVPVGGLLERLRGEFTYHAQAKGLALRVMPCSATIRTDPRLLEQMLRNLISNALKYTRTGRVLVGCRQHGTSQGGTLSIEVWDTGIGIPAAELDAVFDEYHQVGNEARERSRGLGLGLSIVQRLGKLLGHPVRVRSRPGSGSVFTVEVPRVPAPPAPHRHHGLHAGTGNGAVAAIPRGGPGSHNRGSHGHSSHGHGKSGAGSILVVEDDPDLRDLLQQMLQADGHDVASVPDGPAAVQAVQGGARPGLVLADYNLPGGMNGLQAVAALRRAVRGTPAGIPPGPAPVGATSPADMLAADALPAIILTGDMRRPVHCTPPPQATVNIGSSFCCRPRHGVARCLMAS